MKKGEITCVINGYKRPGNLDMLHAALKAQSIPPTEIMLWYNSPGRHSPVNEELLEELQGVFSRRNWGVWARFAYALLAETEYVCIFDDDTIPGARWLENCLQTITQPAYEGLLGTIGLIFETPNSYFPHSRHGWPSQNPAPVEVDIVGHSWFFKREWLHLLFEDVPLDRMAGEDIRFSSVLQQKLGLKTFVPPHPSGQTQWWGSTQAMKLGSTPGEALYLEPDSYSRFDTCFRQTVAQGWQLLCQRKG